VLLLLVTANVVPSSPILVTLIMEAILSLKRWFLQEPHGVTPLKKIFFTTRSFGFASKKLTEKGLEGSIRVLCRDIPTGTEKTMKTRSECAVLGL
jgi:hypothetical protein